MGGELKMRSRVHSPGQSAARFIGQFVLSNGASWLDTFALDVDGAEIAGAGTSAWRLTLSDESGSSQFTASEAAGTLTVTQNTTYTLFALSVPAASLSGLCGSYAVDLVETTAAGQTIHWIHGDATVLDQPASE
jgi:hypothetical protein